jgi:hypothetical protein
MAQMSSLKKLWFAELSNTPNFATFPGANNCLKNLTELCCFSQNGPELFYQLSQICRNIQFLSIDFVGVISNGLADLISAQQSLKYLKIFQWHDCRGLTTDIIISLTNLPNTLIKSEFHGGYRMVPFSLLFIARLTNLQEIILTFKYQVAFEDFKELQYVTFSRLQTLKFKCECPRNELLIKFLENNGKNLNEFYALKSNNSLNLAIAKFCPNLRKLFTKIRKNELETLKVILNNCQHLESIEIRCSTSFSSLRQN